MDLKGLWENHGIGIYIIISVLMYFLYKIGAFESDEKRKKRFKKQAKEIMSAYIKSSYNTKLIILACLMIATIYGIFKIENEKLDESNFENNNLDLKLYVIVIFVAWGLVNSYSFFGVENNKLLKYSYIIYDIIGLFFLFKFFKREDRQNQIIYERKKKKKII